ncbi:NlpC/P60 family protein [Goodfellowiella coeruleoviolacea]|uniref:Cell wall-associated hydrolase, NlpC family n=1 Tax=Goodfellowiella coeruleoviolacea TaxID=334858 RepID=A0AAE3G8R7_9PSEU|nr:NlpC/P60 family protein [Goodfellowiella coeruleoviolacea]MCP2163796.1 Cell wall-associated hydrolase, NlpC family [Goodfellowiella coeruleoviolacea]
MSAPRKIARLWGAGVLSATLLASSAGHVDAVPPAPSAPDEAELAAGRADVAAKTARVGELTSQLAEAETKLRELDNQVALAMENANKAVVDLQTAQDRAVAAQRAADAARVEAELAARAVEDSRRRLDRFAAASFRQGSLVGSLSAYLDARGPVELLARAQLLDAVSESELSHLDQVRRAQVDKAAKDTMARQAAATASAEKARADQAKQQADTAVAEAVRAQRGQAARTAELEAVRADIERQLAVARGRVNGLEAQRKRYEDWVAQQRREESEASRRARQVAPGDVPATVRTVINRALSQVGVPYAWGGGNRFGPTRGIRDGGVADRYGDYAKVGFDCSGLMVYAFAGAGVTLPRYSGYQYNAGRRVPLSRMVPGDMLFWGAGGGQHVALFLGGGMMVEAPYSGSAVRVAPIRYAGLMPYAVRVI